MSNKKPLTLPDKTPAKYEEEITALKEELKEKDETIKVLRHLRGEPKASIRYYEKNQIRLINGIAKRDRLIFRLIRKIRKMRDEG